MSDKLNWRNPAPDAAAAAPSVGRIVFMPDPVILSRCCPTCDAYKAKLDQVERILNDYWQGVGPTDIVPALRNLFPVNTSAPERQEVRP
jgi:hypothetical protein